MSFKILCVDDSKTICDGLEKVLSSEGHTVIKAFDGLQGLDAIKDNPDISIVICDVNMPEMDGVTMYQEVQEQSLIPEAKKIMLTTESSKDLKQKGKEAGVIGWLTKPFDEKKIIAVVNKLISMNQQAA